MATYDRTGRFSRDYAALTPADQDRFKQVLIDRFIPALNGGPPYDSTLRIKKIRGTVDIWEMSWDSDGRATFEFGNEVRAGQTHIVWRRIGTHAIFRSP